MIPVTNYSFFYSLSSCLGMDSKLIYYVRPGILLLMISVIKMHVGIADPTPLIMTASFSF